MCRRSLRMLLHLNSSLSGLNATRTDTHAQALSPHTNAQDPAAHTSTTHLPFGAGATTDIPNSPTGLRAGAGNGDGFGQVHDVAEPFDPFRDEAAEQVRI